jgi:hypothetical protein
VTDTVTGFSSGSFDGISNDSLNDPGADGAKRTVNVQLDEGKMLCPEQLSFRMMNGVESGLSDAIAPVTRFALPLL